MAFAGGVDAAKTRPLKGDSAHDKKRVHGALQTSTFSV